ncbi:MAG TPA: hypothetical protein PLW02_11780 [Verrucomicrobiota bacterium]|nr:hypothetical protein [Verrucomicrobiota bacterium]
MTNIISKFNSLFSRILIFIFVIVCTTVTTFAQIQVELSFPQQQYLAYEPIIAVVKISNVSGQTLNFKKSDNWLDFTMETKSGRIIPKDAEIPQQEDFSIKSGEAGILRVDIQPCFKATSPDRYSVFGTVKIKEWNKVFTSEEKTFDIVTGIKIWEKEFGVPSEDGDNSPEVKKYTLLLANFKDHLRLYFRLSNANEDKVYKMTYMGNLTSIGKPEANLDRFNNLHVLYQVGAKSFRYSVFSPDGRLFIKETHDYTISRPKLWLDQDGRIYVRGGARRFTPEDIPAMDEKLKN